MLLAICAAAFAIRLGYVLIAGATEIGQIRSDAMYYHLGANLLASGEGYVNPLFFHWYGGVRMEGAEHPPAFLTVLAIPSWLGWDSVRAHLIVTCLIGTGTVALIGLIGRRVGGRRTGLLAAGLAAVYPNLWLIDGALMSESLTLLLCAGVTLAAYRAWDQPTGPHFVALGALIGVASLARAEAALLLLMLVIPLAIWRGRRAWLAVPMALVVMAPWSLYNMSRFDEPVTLSTALGGVLAAGNCDDVYSGPYIGFWTQGCQERVVASGKIPDNADGSTVEQIARRQAFDYMGDNVGRLPAVMAARLGRTWGLYAPLQQLEFDKFNDVRPPVPAQLGLVQYYLAAAASVVGVIALRRRRIPSFPLTVWLISVVLAAAAFYGQTRFRAPAEPALMVLAAVGLTTVLPRCCDRRNCDVSARVGAVARAHVAISGSTAP